jgi:tRNA1Val (adenine37-N6)-methyltransferase
MPNNYFQFKQFTVHQEHATVKVSTDSCLFGAWAGEEIRSKSYEVKNILDIGAGTGLLMMMLAQKSNAIIDGIEIDQPSYKQAKGNIEAFAWNERLNIFYGDAKQFEFTKKYDFIISNPPFYEGDLKSDVSNRNIAMHDDGLKLEELLQVVDANLSADGNFAVLLPYHRADVFIGTAEGDNLHLAKRMNVKQSVTHSYFRTMLLFERKKTELFLEELSIKDHSNEYTEQFVELLKDYYLYL